MPTVHTVKRKFLRQHRHQLPWSIDLNERHHEASNTLSQVCNKSRLNNNNTYDFTDHGRDCVNDTASANSASLTNLTRKSDEHGLVHLHGTRQSTWPTNYTTQII